MEDWSFRYLSIGIGIWRMLPLQLPDPEVGTRDQNGKDGAFTVLPSISASSWSQVRRQALCVGVHGVFLNALRNSEYLLLCVVDGQKGYRLLNFY